jgi:hypothetical protein
VLGCGLIAVGDYVAQQFTGLRRVQRVLPFSLENHLPRHYIASSLLDSQKSEFYPPAVPST